MSVIDQTASVANLARMYRDGLDRAAIETKIPTATFELLLNTLIELAEQPQTQQYRERQHREVLGNLSFLEQGIRKAREDAERG